MRINWFSNAPWAATGYGVQTKIFTPRLAKYLNNQISITAFYGLQGGAINVGSIRVYPAIKHPYAQDVMNVHATADRSDAIISLLDAWVMEPRSLTIPWFPWFPIDREPIPAPVLEKVRLATKGITMSKFGQRMAEAAGLETWYVPHAVDTKVFKPHDMRQARERLGLPQDRFIVGMVAANKGITPRKAFYENIAAFAALHKKHADALLYLHTDDGTHGGEVVNLVRYCQRVGLRLGEDVIFCDQYQNAVGFPDDYMVTMYNALDVLLMVSKGEGFGIPLIEAQACGCPVITGAWTAMEELCFSGWKVNKNESMPDYFDGFDAFQFIPFPEAIADRLEKAYQMRGNQDYRSRARDGALAYDADKVFEKYWVPVLAEMEQIVAGADVAVKKVEL